MKDLYFFTAFILIGYGQKIFAFPEMVRHHYVNCSSCHVSPHGGGLTTEYGRHMSKELLSTWGAEGEQNFLYGAVSNEKIKSWLNLGGHYRGTQVHREDKNTKEGRWITMQLGIEVGLTWNQFQLVTLIGKPEGNEKFREVSQKYYLLYQPTEVFSLRGGKFLPTYGLNIPQHTVSIKAPLGIGQGQEREVVEANWMGPKYNFTVSAAKQVRSGVVRDPEFGYTAQFNINIANSYKIGSSYWTSSSTSSEKKMWGLHGILGFTKNVYALFEVDWMDKKEQQSEPVRGLYHFSKLGFEAYRGFHLIGLQDFAQADIKDSKNTQDSRGLGFAFYPRPHFEFEGLWFKKRNQQVSSEYFDYAWFLVHYYF